jgi:hypothetical protein
MAENLHKGFTLKQIKEKYNYNPETGEITLKSGKKVGHKSVANGGYVYLCTTNPLGKMVNLLGHHVALIYSGIPLPKQGEVVDHINQDPADNRLENLRVVSHKQNMQNLSGRKKKVNERYVWTKIPGIRVDKKYGCYVVSLGDDLYTTYDFDDAKYKRWDWEFDNNYHVNHGVGT